MKQDRRQGEDAGEVSRNVDNSYSRWNAKRVVPSTSRSWTRDVLARGKAGILGWKPFPAESMATAFPPCDESPPTIVVDSGWKPRWWATARTACVATVLATATLTGCSSGMEVTGASVSEGSAVVSTAREKGGNDRTIASTAATSKAVESPSSATTGKVKNAGKDSAKKKSSPSASSKTAASPSGSAFPDSKPRPEKGDKAPTKSGPVVGFVPEESGAPNVKRGESLRRQKQVAAEPAPFGEALNYSDGVEVTTGKFRRGTVDQEGAGYITGAAYLVMDIEIRATAERELDLNHVVVTLRFGDEELVAAPLYGETETHDVGGIVPAGDMQTGTYAFMLPTDTDTATLFIDIDGEHAPATVQGRIP